MSTNARRRLVRDLKKIQADPPTGVNAAPLENNLLMWQAVIFGPDDTAWEGGTFNLTMEFTEEYPSKPPKVRFVTPIFHPNVYVDGSICLDLLQSAWTPIYDVGSVLQSIQSLLSDPNPLSPANAEAASLYQTNRPEYERRVREVVEASWVADPEGAAAAATMIEAGDLEDMSGGPDDAVAAAIAGGGGGSSSSGAGSSSSAGGAPSAAAEPAAGAAVGGAGSAAATTAP